MKPQVESHNQPLIFISHFKGHPPGFESPSHLWSISSSAFMCRNALVFNFKFTNKTVSNFVVDLTRIYAQLLHCTY